MTTSRLLPSMKTNSSFFLGLMALLVTLSFPIHGQVKIKKKVVEQAVKDCTIDHFELVASKTFRPGQTINTEAFVVIDGNKVNTEEFNILTRHVKIQKHYDGDTTIIKNLNYGTSTTTHEALSFYPPKAVILQAVFEYTIYRPVKKVLCLKVSDSIRFEPDYCYASFVHFESGAEGEIGRHGTNTAQKGGRPTSGAPGKRGGDGPALNVQVEEDEINGETLILIIVNGKKMAVKPGCGSITIVSKGGNGGSGGDGGHSVVKSQTGADAGPGGNAGNGGTITVSGSKLEKYKQMIKFESPGGNAGSAGSPGHGIDNKNGRKSKSGTSGQPGTVVFTS